MGCRPERWLVILPAGVQLDEFLWNDPNVPVTVWTGTYSSATPDKIAEHLEELYRQSAPDKVICLWKDQPDPRGDRAVGTWPFLLQLFKAHVRHAHAARLSVVTVGVQLVHGAEAHGSATAGYAVPVALFRTLFMEDRGRSGILLDVLPEDLPMLHKVRSFGVS